MRCLFCDGKLPLYRKITHGQFCSTNHRKAYWQEQERLALERLHQTHSSLKAMQPVVSAEEILGPAPTIPAEMALSGFVAPPRIYPQAQGAPWMLAVDPLIYDMELDPGKPVWSAPRNGGGSLPGASLIRLLQVWFASARQAAPGVLKLRGGELDPRAVALLPVKSLTAPVDAGQEFEIPPVAPLLPAKLDRMAAPPAPSFAPAEPLSARVLGPDPHLDLAILLDTPELEAVPEPDVPLADRMLVLGKFAAREQAAAIQPGFMDALTAAEPLPLAVCPEHAVYPERITPGFVAFGEPLPSAIPLPVPPSDHFAELRPVLASVQQAPLQPALALTSRQPRLAMGRGSRYPVQYRHSITPGQPSGPLDFPVLPEDVALPFAPAVANEPAGALIDAIVREPAGMVRLKFRPGKGVTKPIQPILLGIATLPQPLRTEHVILPSGLEPLDSKPISDQFETETAAGPVHGLAGSTGKGLAEKAHVWTRAAQVWNLAPRDLKLLAFAIPALLALAFHRQLPKVHVTAPSAATAQLRDSLHSVVNSQLSGFKQAVVERAGVALDDDFRSGLDDWASRGDATAEWSFDQTGFVRPGPLALYRPSMTLSDYQFQFLGMIDKKAMSWVVRAADWDNYYVVKLEVLKPGPLTTLGLTRYAVIHGKAENRVDTPVRIVDAQPDTLYRVALDMDGENFTLMIQGQMIDSWSEPRLMRGGIGFFTSPGEESRVRWVALRHQYDMLGRLCAYLAPYESPTTNGSW